LRSYFRSLDEARPDVLYAFLSVADLLACLVRFHIPKCKVVWGVRASDMDLAHYDWLSRFTYWLECRLSRCPNLIISNSAVGRSHAVSRGFPDDERFIVIPNGIDVERFRPDPGLREMVRAEWGVLPHERLIGIVARLDPMKDHANFLHAAARLAREHATMRFASVGAGPADYTATLRERARALGLEEKMVWAGPRSDLPAAYNAFDLLVSSSAFGEGFSNVLGEAMACGVPCVATDVGDARDILGDCGVVVPPGDPNALEQGITTLLGRLRTEGATLKQSARARVVTHFGVETLVARTRSALESMP
jgi:glycosyltransferase involved in cell wall biosynthesis